MNRLEELARLKKIYREHKQTTFEMVVHNIDPRIIRQRRQTEEELRKNIKELERLN